MRQHVLSKVPCSDIINCSTITTYPICLHESHNTPLFYHLLELAGPFNQWGNLTHLLRQTENDGCDQSVHHPTAGSIWPEAVCNWAELMHSICRLSILAGQSWQMLSALSLQKAPKMKERITLQPDWESNHFSFVEHGSERRCWCCRSYWR